MTFLESPSEDEKQARAVGLFMETHDVAGQHLGLTLQEIRPGYARVSMTVRADMANGHGICHGGVTYTLADTAFAYASNARNEKSVALSCSITYSEAVHIGDELTAIAVERTLKGHNGLYDVTLTNQNEKIMALFRGHAYRTRESVISIES